MAQASSSSLQPLRRFPSPEAVVAELRPSEPVYCVRPAAIREMARTFVDHFPGDVLYAVKCNPGPHMLRELFAAGIRHFDTASLPEIELVNALFPGSGDEACSSYFMHPVKSRDAIWSAWKLQGVSRYVVDHSAELAKIAGIIPASSDVVIVVRLAVHHDAAVYELSSKFGASIEQAVELLQAAAQRGYSVGLARNGTISQRLRVVLHSASMSGEESRMGLMIPTLDASYWLPAT